LRLSKYLSRAGVASRRKAEELIRAGMVEVNGEVAYLPQTRVNPGDIVEVSGRPVLPPSRYLYILLHKPRGYVTTMHDPGGRPAVGDILPNLPVRVYPVGRLDKDVSGVLLFTNDGELAYRLAHPSYEVPKTYRVEVAGLPAHTVLQHLRRGVILEEGKTAPAQIRKVKMINSGGNALLDVTLHQGWKRQVKRMFQAVGHPVRKMQRIRFAFLEVEGLAPGSYRYLHKIEIEGLQKLVGLAGEENGNEDS